jgi:hypothetical protein
MKKTILTLAVLVMAFGNVGLAQQRINLKSIEKAAMLKHYGLRDRNDMVPQTATWQDTYGDKYRVQYEYDENEFYLNTEMYEVFWDGVWQEYEMISYEYDFNGNVLEMLVSDFDGEEWWDMGKATFEYEDDLVSEVIVQYWEDGEWVNEEKAVYNYNGDNWTILYWTWNGTTWSSNELYTYNKSAESIELLIQYMQGGAWQNDEQQFFTLDFDEHVTSILVQDWENNAWVNDNRTTYDFANGVFDSKIEESWDGSDWEITTKYGYIYDNGNAINGFCMVLDGDDFVPGDGDIEMAYGYSADSKSFYGYEVNVTYIDPTGIGENGTKVSFQVYPVPAENEIQIQAEGFQKAEIFTLTGQMLLESVQNTINVSGLASGIYLLKVYDQTGNSVSQKLVVK